MGLASSAIYRTFISTRHHTGMRNAKHRKVLGRWGFALIASICLPATLALAQLPALGDGSGMTVAAERKLGEKIARELYRDPDYIDDPVLADYVQGIWQPLLAAARQRGEVSPELDERFSWEILLGKDRTINAFALPGGFLGLHLGLVGSVANRDELASVLAHELTHVTQRHISRMVSQQNRQTPLLIGAMVLAAIAAAKNPDAANAVVAGGQALALQGQLNFSRDMEREADRIGFGVMSQAGFEPSGFVTMFDKLQQASRLNDSGAFPYLRTHPLTTERIADMQSRLPLDARRRAQPVSLVHTLMVARAQVLSSPDVDGLRARATKAAAGSRSAQGDEQQATTAYAAALASARLREFAAARQWLARLLALVPAGADAAMATAKLLEAEVALESGEATGALAALAAMPSAGGQRAATLLRAQAQIAAGQAGVAAQQLQTWVALHGRDALAWQLLSAARNASGQPLQAIRADAEARVAQFDYAAALDRFKAAQLFAKQSATLTGNDHIEASIVDSRTRHVELLLREQALER